MNELPEPYTIVFHPRDVEELSNEEVLVMATKINKSSDGVS